MALQEWKLQLLTQVHKSRGATVRATAAETPSAADSTSRAAKSRFTEEKYPTIAPWAATAAMARSDGTASRPTTRPGPCRATHRWAAKAETLWGVGSIWVQD